MTIFGCNTSCTQTLKNNLCIHLIHFLTTSQVKAVCQALCSYKVMIKIWPFVLFELHRANKTRAETGAVQDRV